MITPARRRILVVDDDAVFRERLARALRDRGYEVATADDRAAARAAATDRVDGAVIDLMLGTESGLDVVGDLHRLWPAARLAIATGSTRGRRPDELLTTGASGIILKPLDADDVAEFLESDTASQG